MEDVQDAAKLANVHDFIMTLPEGLARSFFLFLFLPFFCPWGLCRFPCAVASRLLESLLVACCLAASLEDHLFELQEICPGALARVVSVA